MSETKRACAPSGRAARAGLRHRIVPLVVALLATAGSPAAVAIDQEPLVRSLVVRFHDADPRTAPGILSTSAVAQLNRALQLSTSAAGRTADGAHRLALDLPVPASAAREALNRVRATGNVLYAEAEPAAAPATRVTAPRGRVERLIVKMRAGKRTAANGAGSATDALRRIEAVAGQPIRVERRLGDGADVLHLTRGMWSVDARAVADAIAADPAVEYAEPERRAYAQSMLPDDPLFAEQWNLVNAAGGVNAAAGWAYTTGDPSVFVAVIDSGALPHPDLVSRFVGGYDFVSDPRFSNDGDGRDPDPTDPGDWLTQDEIRVPESPFAGCVATNSSWHGTEVSGIVAATGNNAMGIAGMNWQSPVVPVRVLGKCGASTVDIVDAIRWAAGLAVPGVPDNPHPARVLNLSLSGDGACGNALQSSINDALSAGAVVVVAAGNDGEDAANHFPANCNGVVAVAGSTRDGGRLTFSNFGNRIALAAPSGGYGGNVTTTRNDGMTGANPAGYVYAMAVGTSFAAPHVAGAASLLLSVDPSLSAAQILSILQSSARKPPVDAIQPCASGTCGAGLLDAGAALAKVADNVPPVDRSPPSPANPALTTPVPLAAPDLLGDRRTEARNGNAALARSRPARR